MEIFAAIIHHQNELCEFFICLWLSLVNTVCCIISMFILLAWNNKCEFKCKSRNLNNNETK